MHYLIQVRDMSRPFGVEWHTGTVQHRTIESARYSAPFYLAELLKQTGRPHRARIVMVVECVKEETGVPDQATEYVVSG